MKTIQSAIYVIAGIAFFILGIIIVFGVTRSFTDYIFGGFLMVLGCYFIARGMLGLGFKAQPHVGLKLPL